MGFNSVFKGLMLLLWIRSFVLFLIRSSVLFLTPVSPGILMLIVELNILLLVRYMKCWFIINAVI